MKLQDKVAIVTGGGRGLGRSIALAFGKEGARVVLAARTEKEIEHVAEELRALKRDVIAVKTDVTVEEDVANLVEKTLQECGAIDILINNAGERGHIGPVCELSVEQWDYIIRANLTSAFICSKSVLPVMMENRYGKIINIATTTTPRPNLTPYMVAKAGLIHFTKQLAREMKDFNIQVNAIHPGVMDTRMQKEIRKAGANVIGTDMFERMKEEGILKSPDEPAQLVLFLASRVADGITGRFLSFDDTEVKFLVSQP
ncbi:MAG: SDR family oxidoreductase [Syntrophaceae bacterium]|nr:SDR family oxidoreductase [Syntrophaceae bacterium]